MTRTVQSQMYASTGRMMTLLFMKQTYNMVLQNVTNQYIVKHWLNIQIATYVKLPCLYY